jgi:hypothetical protein
MEVVRVILPPGYSTAYGRGAVEDERNTSPPPEWRALARFFVHLLAVVRHSGCGARAARPLRDNAVRGLGTRIA